MSKPKKVENRKREVFRSLENYKAMQAKVAESKGRLEQLKAASTLTAARRIVYGR